jgi:hypothetical protein
MLRQFECTKAARKINFDEDKSSPVSGCIIKDLSDCEEGKVVYGDIDSSYNYVEVTPEARAAIDKIENKIGDYICRLCKDWRRLVLIEINFSGRLWFFH